MSREPRDCRQAYKIHAGGHDRTETDWGRTDSQAEGRGFESPFPLQTNKIKAPSDVVSTIRAQKAEGRGFESRFLLHTQSLAEQGVPHGLLLPLSARP